MDSISSLSFLRVALMLLLAGFQPAIAGCFTGIISFGDSLADTGNFIRSEGGESKLVYRPPYGETYFNHPTGRFSDGRIILDFIAEAVGLPFVEPYLKGLDPEDLLGGVNFAVAGATVLDNDFFKERGLNVTWTPYSLSVQIQWFKGLLSSLTSSPGSDYNNSLSKSLFIIGEIGGVDYNCQLSQGRTLEEIQPIVPFVIQNISSAIEVLIGLGAKTLVVPGNFPIGCFAAFLASFKTNRSEDYDPNSGCINSLNELSVLHNRRLKDEIERLRRRHQHATIVYADYYEAAMTIFRSPGQFGFREAALDACCGGGGPYNYNKWAPCGDEGSIVCEDPSKYVCWDGMHYTEAAYKRITNYLLAGPLASLPIGQRCSGVERNIFRYHELGVLLN